MGHSRAGSFALGAVAGTVLTFLGAQAAMRGGRGGEAQSAAALEKLIEISPSLLWLALIVGVLIWRRRDVDRFFGLLSQRVQAGAPVNISGIIEIGGVAGRLVNAPHAGGQVTKDSSRNDLRKAFYQDNRHIMVVHTLHASSSPGQVFDVLVYLQPRGQGSLLGVKLVEYYFGSHWNDIVISTDRRVNSYAVKVSAYGAFLCLARIVFTDETTSDQYRYIDFEGVPHPPLIHVGGDTQQTGEEPLESEGALESRY